jgi:hypothetical protein
MAVIKGDIDPHWHERELIVLILSRGPLQKNELFKRIAEEQEKRIVIDGEPRTHSKSAYEYWVKQHKEQWVVSQRAGTLELTSLGKWIATSKLGTVLYRNYFVSFICPGCIIPADLALLKPQLDTRETNAMGRLFMDMECPRCDYRVPRVGISEVLSEGKFIRFYNDTLTQLQRIVNITGQLLEG